jgi:integrase
MPRSKVKTLQLLLETGARSSEVLNARWEDLDFEAQLWRLPDSKSGRPQTIHLAAETVAWLKETPRSGVFLVPGPSPLKRRHSLRSAWVRVAERAGLEGVHLHDLRRSFGRRVTLMAAQLALRHSRPEVTSRVYAPVLGSEQSETIARVVPMMRGRARA